MPPHDPLDRAYVPRTQRGLAGVIVLWTLGIVALVGVVIAVGWAWTYTTASTAGKVSARKTIQSGPFRIAAYQHFFQLCSSIQGLEGTLDAQTSALADATGDERDRIRANVAGIEGARAQAIAQYNAEARESYTIGQFRSKQLPYQIPTAPYVKGEHTSCNA